MKKSTVMNTLRKKIREHKYKFTSQRQVILQAFLDSKEKHLSAEDLYAMVRDENPDIGLATVYSHRWSFSKSSTSVMDAAAMS